MKNQSSLTCILLVFTLNLLTTSGSQDSNAVENILSLHHGVDITATPNPNLTDEVLQTVTHSEYLLYTRSNPILSQALMMNDEKSIINSNFDPNHNTVVVVHGWLGSQISLINPTIRQALLKDNDMNVIYVDWSTVATKDYVTATIAVPTLGRFLGEFLEFLQSVTRISFDNMHLIGFSLGAHFVGNAGRELDGRVARITGLDPAGPLWYSNINRLNKTDAAYVEVIHTNAFGLGLPTAIGDADFFPNGGSLQPGCFNPLCNHNRAWELYAATVKNNQFVGKQCPSIAFMNLNECDGKSFLMGNDDLKKFGSGIYRLKTRASYPFLI